MNIILLLFVIGIILISIGYANQQNPRCNLGSEIRIVPRDVYDEIILDSAISA